MERVGGRTHCAIASGRCLAGVWAAKAVLNAWRAGTAVWRIDVALPRCWAAADDAKASAALGGCDDPVAGMAAEVPAAASLAEPFLATSAP